MTAIVTYEHESLERDGWFVPKYRTEPRGPEWLRSLLGVDYFSAVRGVDFFICPTTDLSPLADLPLLEKLVVCESPASDLSPVTNLTHLRILTISETQVVDLTPLANLTALEFLLLKGDSIDDITPLAHLANLRELTLEDTRTRDFSPLAQLTNLKKLYLCGLHIDDLPVQNLASLEILSVNTSDITHAEIRRLRRALPNCELWYSISARDAGLQAKDILFQFLQVTGGRWPKNWEELRSSYEVVAARGEDFCSFDELRDRVWFNWFLTPDDLRKAVSLRKADQRAFLSFRRGFLYDDLTDTARELNRDILRYLRSCLERERDDPK
jgi:hypothetical protein